MRGTKRPTAAGNHGSAVVAWLAGWVFAPDSASSLLDDAKLERAGTWVAGGFGALAAVLAFLGVREGLLDRLLRSAPSAALYVFALLGAGILCGLLAPALLPNKRIHLGWPLMLLELVLVLTKALLPDVGTVAITVRQVVFGALLVFATVVLFRVPVSLVAASLTLAVAFTATGLYGAAQLSVGSKLFTSQPQVTATVQEHGDVDAIAVSVLLSHAEEGRRMVDVFADAGSESKLIGRAVLAPDAVGGVDVNLSFPVDASDWSSFSIRVCRDERDCKPGEEVLRLAGSLESPIPLVGGSFARLQSGAVSAAVSGSALRVGHEVLVRVESRRAGSATTTDIATVAATSSGALDWSLVLPSGQAGDRLELSYRVCRSTCASEVHEPSGFQLLATMTR